MRRTIIAMLLCVGVVGAQQAGSLVWQPNGSSVTVNAPTNGGTLTYALPVKSGTLALTTDIPPPATPVITSGTITLSNGAGTATIPITVVRCVVSDPSGNSVKYTRGAGTLSVSGVGPTVDYACF